MENLLTMEEVAERLNTTPRHVRRLVSARRIAYRKLANRIEVGANQRASGTAARIPPTSATHTRRAG